MTKASGKLDLLAKMLKVLKQDGHRVLLFSQVSLDCDEIELVTCFCRVTVDFLAVICFAICDDS